MKIFYFETIGGLPLKLKSRKSIHLSDWNSLISDNGREILCSFDEREIQTTSKENHRIIDILYISMI